MIIGKNIVFMDCLLLLISIAFIFFGIVIMKNNRFYDYSYDDMLFATKLKIFLCGFLICAVGLYGVINQILTI